MRQPSRQLREREQLRKMEGSTEVLPNFMFH
jgi:hypothetical protein